MKKRVKFSLKVEDPLISQNFPNSSNIRLEKKLYVSAFQKYLNCLYTSNIFRFTQIEKYNTFLGHPVYNDNSIVTADIASI